MSCCLGKDSDEPRYKDLYNCPMQSETMRAQERWDPTRCSQKPYSMPHTTQKRRRAAPAMLNAATQPGDEKIVVNPALRSALSKLSAPQCAWHSRSEARWSKGVTMNGRTMPTMPVKSRALTRDGHVRAKRNGGTACVRSNAGPAATDANVEDGQK